MATLDHPPGLTLITGASAGIGQELARVFASQGHPLVLVARRRERLEILAAELNTAHAVTVQPLPLDLLEPEAPGRLAGRLRELDMEPDILINNAGFGSYGLFHTLDLKRELAMLQLNVVALTHLTHLFLGRMVERGRGGVMNVASTAAFQPGPLMAVYYATKAFVLSFSEALAEEVQSLGVHVTALCPGPTKSEFQTEAGMDKSRLARHFLMDAKPVAEVGYRALIRGRRVAIPGIFNKMTAQTHRLLPRSWITKLVRKIQAGPQ